MTEESQRLKIGSIVADRYRITGSIASGANGDVFKAHHVDLGTDVAVKILRASLKEDTEALTRLRREAQALSSVRHPNVVRVTAVANDAAIGLILVMELLEGQTLSRRIESHGRFSLPETLKIMAGMCSGLDAIHRQNILHRDLKPSNIILASGTNDSDERPVLIDFGLVKHINSEQRLTSTNAVLGTPLYMSPEQGRSEELDSRTDIYSLSCILYEMLSGAAPFQGDTVFDLMMQHINEEPLPISFEGESAKVSKQVNAVIAKGMAKDPDYRFQSGAELLSALQRAAVGQFEDRRPAPVRKTLAKFSAVPVLTIGVLIVLVLGVSTWVMKSTTAAAPTVRIDVTPNAFDEKYNLAYKGGNFDKAARLAHEQIINFQSSKDYKSTIDAWVKYVEALREQGRFMKAKAECAAARKWAQEKNMGKHPIDMVESSVRAIEGDYNGVVNCLYQYKGVDSPRPSGTAQRLSEALLHENRYAEAIECAEVSDAKTGETFEKLNARISKAGALVGQKKYNDARVLLVETAENAEANRREVQQERLFALLAITYKHLILPAESKEYCRRALRGVSGSIKDGSPGRRRREQQKQYEIREMLHDEGLSKLVPQPPKRQLIDSD